jgi:hypothetical protein
VKNLQLVTDVVTAVTAARLFGADVRRIARRVIAAGVRMGAAELARCHSRKTQGGGR